MIRAGKESVGLDILEKWWGAIMKHAQKEFKFSNEETAFKISVFAENTYVFMVHPRVHKLFRKCFRKRKEQMIPKKNSDSKIEFRGTRKIIFYGIDYAIIMNVFKEILEQCGAKIKRERKEESEKIKEKLYKVEEKAKIFLKPIFGNYIKYIRASFLKKNPPEKKYCLNIKTKRRTAKKNGLFDTKIFGSSSGSLIDRLRKMYDIE